MSEWQPIETAPKEPFVEFLVADANGERYFAFRAVLDEDAIYPSGQHDELQWWISQTEARQSCDPTHWMPLPAVPEAK